MNGLDRRVFFEGIAAQLAACREATISARSREASPHIRQSRCWLDGNSGSSRATSSLPEKSLTNSTLLLAAERHIVTEQIVLVDPDLRRWRRPTREKGKRSCQSRPWSARKRDRSELASGTGGICTSPATILQERLVRGTNGANIRQMELFLHQPPARSDPYTVRS